MHVICSVWERLITLMHFMAIKDCLSIWHRLIEFQGCNYTWKIQGEVLIVFFKFSDPYICQVVAFLSIRSLFLFGTIPTLPQTVQDCMCLYQIDIWSQILFHLVGIYNIILLYKHKCYIEFLATEKNRI
jgi:hypothetical protein